MTSAARYITVDYSITIEMSIDDVLRSISQHDWPTTGYGDGGGGLDWGKKGSGGTAQLQFNTLIKRLNRDLPCLTDTDRQTHTHTLVNMLGPEYCLVGGISTVVC